NMGARGLMRRSLPPRTRVRACIAAMPNSIKRSSFALTRYTLLSALALAPACKTPAEPETVQPADDPTIEPETPAVSDGYDHALGNPEVDAAALTAKVAQFQPVVLEADLAALPESERAALDELIGAARLLDPIFDRQVWADYPEHEQRLIRSEEHTSELQS